MPSYRAQRQSLSGEVGGPRDMATPGVDYRGILDAITGGASSLIQQQYLRRVQDRQFAREAQQDQLSREKFDFEKDTKRQELAHQQTMDEAKLLAEGYDTKPHVRHVPNIAKAMLGASGLGQPDEFTVTQTEPHFDLERNVAYRTATDRARIGAEAAEERARAGATERAKLQADRLAAQQSGREYMAQAARSLAVLRSNLRGKEAGVRGAMTGNALEEARTRAAEGLLSRTGGSYDEALALLTEGGDEAKSFRAIGVEPRHLSYAMSKLVNSGTGQAMRAQTTLGETPDSSAMRVGATRKAVAGLSKKERATGPAPGAPAAPGAPGGAKPKRTPEQAAAGAAELVSSGKATIEQALASRSLSDSAKKILKKQFGDSTRKKK